MADNTTKVEIKKVTQETPQMRLFVLGEERPWTFIPGQVAVLSTDGQNQSYFALASAPEDKGGVEVLIKENPGTPNLFYNLKAGDSFIVKGGPVGKGFPIDKYKQRNLFLAAVGSAISPLRSVMRSISYRPADFGKISFICGVRNPDDLPFAKEMESWKKAGVNVITTVSKPTADWSGKTGYVPTHFKEALASLDKPVALICGMKAMMEQSRAELTKLGVTPDEILTNY